jgi:hypothetical protein
MLLALPHYDHHASTALRLRRMLGPCHHYPHGKIELGLDQISFRKTYVNSVLRRASSSRHFFT